LKAVNQDGKYFEPVPLLARIGIERARYDKAFDNYFRALSYFQKMLKALENTAKTKTASAANCLYMIGWCNYAMVKLEEALSYFKRALPLFEKIMKKKQNSLLPAFVG
jgi:tetratricopeptide (TPR) repeat protein